MKRRLTKIIADGGFPAQFRVNVTGGNQFQLPPLLVTKVGFRSPKWDPTQSAKVAWFYHENHDKAVLAHRSANRPSLEPVGASALYGVSNDDLDAEDVSSARVTIISELPDSVYNRLTDAQLLLKPKYASDYTDLDNTFVSVYPAAEYDNGDLPNMTHKRIDKRGESNSSKPAEPVGSFTSYADSI